MFIAPTTERPLPPPLLPATRPTPLFPSPLNHAGFFSYLAAPPTLSFPFDPLLSLHHGVSAVLRMFCFKTFRLLFSLSSYPRPFRAHSLLPLLVPLNPDPSTTSLFANVSPTLFLSFVVHLALTHAVRSFNRFLVPRAGQNSWTQTGSLRPSLRELSFFEFPRRGHE